MMLNLFSRREKTSLFIAVDLPLTSSLATSWRATASDSKNLAPGRISRRQSQKVLLPVEMPPVIPIAGISDPMQLRFLRRHSPPATSCEKYRLCVLVHENL